MRLSVFDRVHCVPLQQYYSSFCVVRGVFAEDDLDRILAFKTRVQPQPGTVTGEDKGLRDCNVRWIYAATSGTGWLFEPRGAPSRTRWLTRRKTVT